MNSQDVYLHLCSILQAELLCKREKREEEEKKTPFNTLTPNHVLMTSSEGRQTDFGAWVSEKEAN